MHGIRRFGVVRAGGMAFFCLLLCFGGKGVAGQSQTTARIFGVVLDQATGKPIEDVHVSILPAGIEDVTSSAGRFSLRGIPFGRHTIRFERLGYVTRVDTLQAGRGRPMDIVLRLATEAIPLDPIEVTVRSGELDRIGFYERRDFEINGKYFTAEDIDRLKPLTLTDLMYRLPSTLVIHAGPGRTLLRFNRQTDLNLAGRLRGCEPAVFVDGALVQDQLIEPRLLDFNRVPPPAVAGIEVYIGVNTPLEYRRNACGSVLIWTKRGG
ncbi:MAG: TonB-dependent receptor [Gemmatimonadota bacterium]|jgi:hypothetical protein